DVPAASSHPRIDSQQTKGITNPFCKEPPSDPFKSGKIDYFPIAVSASKSAASEFFTGDYPSRLRRGIKSTFR
ncbi:MAG: hypothetical protein KGJ53_10570, partial [Alphaproteobacteria bacterium]|nr:hypothetical protein [Alphaproteobacteria bacterium]